MITNGFVVTEKLSGEAINEITETARSELQKGNRFTLAFFRTKKFTAKVGDSQQI